MVKSVEMDFSRHCRIKTRGKRATNDDQADTPMNIYNNRRRRDALTECVGESNNKNVRPSIETFPLKDPHHDAAWNLGVGARQ